jgi:hypothetical protein
MSNRFRLCRGCESLLLSCLWLITASVVHAQDFGDEFDGPPLGSEWQQANITIGFTNDTSSRITLTGPNNTLGRIFLPNFQGCNSGLFPLRWPWAFETHMRVPNVDPNLIPFKGAIGLQVYYADKQSLFLELGRLAGPGKNVIYAIGSTYAENVTGIPALEQATNLYLRIEGVGTDQRTIRLGARLNAADSWHWCSTNILPQAVVAADTFQLLKHDASHGGVFSPQGDPVTFAFDYARFWGVTFTTLQPAWWAPPTFDPGLLTVATNMHPFDLETRARLAINALNNTIDTTCQVPYVLASLTPPVSQSSSPGVLCGEYLDGLTMARLISNEQSGVTEEQLMKESIIRQMVNGLGDSAGGPDVIEIAGHKHLLPALLNWYRLEPTNSLPLQLLAESFNTFSNIALSGTLTNGQPYLYYPVPSSEPTPGDWSAVLYNRSGWQWTNEPINTGSACFEGVLMLPFAEYYDYTHDPAVEAYLDKFSRFLLERATDYNSDGSFAKADVTNGQLWSRMMTMEGILLYGLASGRTDLVRWAWGAYNKALQLHGTSFGWLPENLAFDHGLGCETDTMTAQIEMAFILARRVDDSYWEVAERIAMNQLMAQQLLRVDFLGNYYQELGGFASFCSPNDWSTPEGPYITQSAHGSGTRALYDVWYHAAWWEQGDQPGEAGRTLRVNLHWSKNLPGAQVISHLPSDTTLEVDLQRPCHLIVRKPDWAALDQIQVSSCDTGTTQTNPVSFVMQGRWMQIGYFSNSTRIIIQLPNTLTAHIDWIHDPTPHEFTTYWRGNTVIDMEPAGTNQFNYADRAARPPYVPTYTAASAIDPVFMTPVEQTDALRSDRGDAASRVALTITPSGNQWRLSWVNPQYILQQSADLSNPSGWQDVPGATNSPVFLDFNSSHGFYRLNKL